MFRIAYTDRDTMKNRITPDEAKASKSQGKKCYCPACREEVFPKCGSVRVHHFCHEKNSVCKYGSGKGKTEWHLRMQNYFPDDWQEVAIENNRADVYDSESNVVFEFQHSGIDWTEMFSRTEYYLEHGKKLVWVFAEEKPGALEKDNFSDGNSYYWKGGKNGFQYNVADFYAHSKIDRKLFDNLVICIWNCDDNKEEGEDYISKIVAHNDNFSHITLSQNFFKMSEMIKPVLDEKTVWTIDLYNNEFLNCKKDPRINFPLRIKYLRNTYKLIDYSSKYIKLSKENKKLNLLFFDENAFESYEGEEIIAYLDKEWKEIIDRDKLDNQLNQKTVNRVYYNYPSRTTYSFEKAENIRNVMNQNKPKPKGNSGHSKGFGGNGKGKKR